MTKYIYVILFTVFNYLLTYAIGYFIGRIAGILLVQNLSDTDPITVKKAALAVVYSINIIIVLIEWKIFKKYIGKIKPIASNNINILMFVGVLIIPIFYIIYRFFIGIPYTDTSDTSIVLYSIVSNIILLPIIEELIYRDILFRVFFKNSDDVVKGILFISFLFTLTHIGSWNINWLYLIHIFFLSIFFFFLRIKYGLLYAILAHSFINFTWFLLKIRIIDIIF